MPARAFTLAGIIKYTMPFLNPGSLTDEEAQDVAAFINSSRGRPTFKDRDYRNGRIPADARLLPASLVRDQNAMTTPPAARQKLK